MGGGLVTPRWLARILWSFRGKRLVRLQLIDPPKGSLPTLEGILVGCWSGHYVLLAPKAIESATATVTLEGHVEVPKERVAFIQVMH